MKSNWVCDEEGLICSACGKDTYHCQCEEEGLEGIRQGNKREVVVDKTVLSFSIEPQRRLPRLGRGVYY